MEFISKRHAVNYVRIRKTAAAPDPPFPAGCQEDYPIGAVSQTHSLPVEYWVEGWLQAKPEVGKPVLVFRNVRSGVATPGIFISSQVTGIHPRGFYTLNSVYELEVIPAPAPRNAAPGTERIV